jgi:hypothetical protein
MLNVDVIDMAVEKKEKIIQEYSGGTTIATLHQITIK